jgi:hypothetical protein
LEFFGVNLKKGNFHYQVGRIMLDRYSLAQKKAGIVVFGIIVTVLATVNRSFLENIVVSGVVVVLIIVFFLLLILFLIDSRKHDLQSVPQTGKRAARTTKK